MSARSFPPEPPTRLAGSRLLVRLGNFLFHYRNALFPLVFPAVALATRPRMFLGSETADRWADLLGLAVVVAGQGLRVLVIGLAYIRRGGKDGRIYADDLVTGGIFAHSRNPLYLGNMMVFGGLFLVLDSPAGWAIGAPFFFLAYVAITAAEEDFLGRKFGEQYRDYCRRVNRFLLSPAGVAETVRVMRFDWRRVVRVEYGSAFAWITAFLGLAAWERIAWHGAAAERGALRAAAMVWAAAIAAYLTARILKKTGRLDSD